MRNRLIFYHYSTHLIKQNLLLYDFSEFKNNSCIGGIYFNIFCPKLYKNSGKPARTQNHYSKMLFI